MWKLRFIGSSFGDTPIDAWEVLGSGHDIAMLYKQIRMYWHFTYLQVERPNGELQDWD